MCEKIKRAQFIRILDSHMWSLPILPFLVCDAVAKLRFSEAAPLHRTNAAAMVCQVRHIAMRRETIDLKRKQR